MGYFEVLRKKYSPFYQRLWQELNHIKVIDTHKHITPMPGLIKEFKLDFTEKNPFRGHILEVDAIDLAEQVLYSNPKRIFGL